MKEKIKEFLKQNWFKIGLLVILVVSITSAFYWFEWRPQELRKRCYKASLPTLNFELNYKSCIRSYGLEK